MLQLSEWSTLFLEKCLVAYPVDPYEIQSFITVLTSTHGQTKCWNCNIQPMK